MEAREGLCTLNCGPLNSWYYTPCWDISKAAVTFPRRVKWVKGMRRQKQGSAQVKEVESVQEAREATCGSIKQSCEGADSAAPDRGLRNEASSDL